MNAIAEALPDADTLLAGGLMESALSGGMDHGAPHARASYAPPPGSPSGISRFLSDRGLPAGWPLAAESEAAIREWLPRRVRRVLDGIATFARTTPDGMMVIRRDLRVSAADGKRIVTGESDDPLGAYWTWNAAGTDDLSAWGEGGKLMRIFAVVDPADVDWETSIARNADYVQGDDEAEAFVPDACVRIIGIEFMGRLLGPDEIADPVRRTGVRLPDRAPEPDGGP